MSSRKNNLPSFKLLNAVSLAVSVTSPATNIAYLDNVGVQIDLTGTPNGTVSIEVSNTHQEDNNGNITVQGTFVPLQQSDGTPVAQLVTAGAPNPLYFDLKQLSATYIRVVFTRTSGTGTITAVISAKML